MTTYRVTRNEPRSVIGDWHADLIAGQLIDLPDGAAEVLLANGGVVETDETPEVVEPEPTVEVTPEPTPEVVPDGG